MNILKTTKLKKGQLKKLAEFFATVNTNQNEMSLTKLHGFFTAIVSAPSLIMPSQWLPIVTGEGSQEAVSNSMEEAQETIGLIMQLYNQICGDLQNLNANEFSLLLWDDGNILTIQESSWEVLSEWCNGYLLGTAFFREHPKFDDHAIVTLFPLGVLAGKFSLIGGKDNEGNIIEDDIPYKERFKKDLLIFTGELYNYWRNNTDDNFFQPESHNFIKKIGRNEPCPCGSGKKYKKCCG